VLELSDPVAIGIQPLAQPRPVGEQRLVRDLDDGLAARLIAVCDEQPRLDELARCIAGRL
jgi:hypothetical protein